jgi:hypothetical protein
MRSQERGAGRVDAIFALSFWEPFPTAPFPFLKGNDPTSQDSFPAERLNGRMTLPARYKRTLLLQEKGRGWVLMRCRFVAMISAGIDRLVP